jgi:hypothetical protein
VGCRTAVCFHSMRWGLQSFGCMHCIGIHLLPVAAGAGAGAMYPQVRKADESAEPAEEPIGDQGACV